MSASIGPLTLVKTQAAAVGLDVGRSLSLRGATMKLVRKDPAQPSKWATVLDIPRGWNRTGYEERSRGRGYAVHFRVADLYNGALYDGLNGPNRGTHLLVLGVYHEIESVPPVPPDKAQVYDITCRTHTLVSVTAGR